MFPLKDNISTRTFPYVNIGLIVINALFFIYQISYGPAVDKLIFTLGFIPARFIAQQGENLLNPAGFLPVFGSMFLHANLIHLLSNMWMLWIFGDNVEDCMGHGRYLLFFFLCGIASVLAQAVSNPQSVIPMIGASGAFSGVLGAYFLTYPQARILTLVPIIIDTFYANCFGKRIQDMDQLRHITGVISLTGFYIFQCMRMSFFILVFNFMGSHIGCPAAHQPGNNVSDA